MKKHLLFLAFALLLPTAIMAQIWKNDPAHSRMEFTISHTLISDMGGVFNDFSIDINASQPDFSDAAIEVVVQTKSVDTEVAQRDDHLRSPDFFDVAQFPEMRFKSSGIKQIDGKTFLVTGELTLHGVSKSVDLTMVHNGSYTKDGKTISGITVSGKILRSDFNFGP
ncbi:MAG TPA: YceI family protein, partial [Arenibacter sp.]|nr:YceI family protein [Arenibacter sp.]